MSETTRDRVLRALTEEHRESVMCDSSGSAYVAKDGLLLTVGDVLAALRETPEPVAPILEFCVCCGQRAGNGNSYHVPPALNTYAKFAVCDGCHPGSADTAPLTDEMEPEEAALRCWHWSFTGRGIPFDEIAESLMRWTELRAAPSRSPAREPPEREEGSPSRKDANLAALAARNYERINKPARKSPPNEPTR